MVLKQKLYFDLYFVDIGRYLLPERIRRNILFSKIKLYLSKQNQIVYAIKLPDRLFQKIRSNTHKGNFMSGDRE